MSFSYERLYTILSVFSSQRQQMLKISASVSKWDEWNIFKIIGLLLENLSFSSDYAVLTGPPPFVKTWMLFLCCKERMHCSMTLLVPYFDYVCLLLFYVLETPKVIAGWVQTCDNVHSFRLSNAAPLGNQAASTMTRCPTQSHYPDTEPTSPCPTLIMLNT